MVVWVHFRIHLSSLLTDHHIFNCCIFRVTGHCKGVSESTQIIYISSQLATTVQIFMYFRHYVVNLDFFLKLCRRVKTLWLLRPVSTGYTILQFFIINMRSRISEWSIRVTYVLVRCNDFSVAIFYMRKKFISTFQV